jgi:hypothetical protein
MRKINALLEAGLGICIIAALLIALVLTPPGAQASPQASLPAIALAVASAASAAPAPVAEAPAQSPATVPVLVAVEPAGTGALADYVLEAMTAWKKPGRDAVSYSDVARDIASACIASEPLWSNDTKGVRCAILLASLAFYEGGFLAYVDDGRVNDGKWREQAFKKGITWSPNISDDGEAFSLWQIHPEKGIVLTDDGEWKHTEGVVTDTQGNRRPGVVIGPDLTKNRKLAVRVAIAFVRKSLRVTHSLVGYTGETAATGYGKARSRELFASNWVKRHPFNTPR